MDEVAAGWRRLELAWREAEFERRLEDARAEGPVTAGVRRWLLVTVRRDAQRIRPGRWLTRDELVARALADRLGESNMAGPWEPLSPSERAQAARPGRRLYTSYARYAGVELDAQLSATVPVELVWRARTAAFRWNEREVAPRLTSLAEDSDPDAIAAVYGTYGQSLGRLAREGLSRYLATPPVSRC